MMSAAEARRKARAIREDAAKQASSAVRYELSQVADQFDQLAAELEKLQREEDD